MIVPINRLHFVFTLSCLANSFRLTKLVTKTSNLKSQSETSIDSNTEENLLNKLVKTGSESDKLRVNDIFKAFTNDKQFFDTIWQKRPLLCKETLKNLDGGYVSDDLKEAVDNDFIEAGRGSFDEGRTGWSMKAVSKPRGKSFEEAKLRFTDIEVALKEKSGTVVINSAGGFIPKMAEVCLDSMEAFQLPLALNMYVTNPGQRTSAPPHTDKQDVFVLQTQGRKHWRVYNPPPPSRMPRVDPFARGKSADMLDLMELEKPLIDVTLYPGNMLYIPAGFPHTTDTEFGDASESTQPSLHLTLGVDTHIWSLNYAAVRSMALKRAGLPDKLMLTKLDTTLYFDLQSTLPIGFLQSQLTPSDDHPLLFPPSSALPTEQLVAIAEIAVKKIRAAEPTRWPVGSVTDEELITQLDLVAVIARIVQHRYELVNIFRTMYSDVAYQITPVTMNLSFFRSQPYFGALEELMVDLEAWAAKPSATAIAAASVGKNDDKTKDAKSSNSSNKSKPGSSSSKGFGSK